MAMINALVRFAARRPSVTSFYRDNGRNFTKAQKLLKREVELFAKQKGGELELRGLRWELNPLALHTTGERGRG